MPPKSIGDSSVISSRFLVAPLKSAHEIMALFSSSHHYTALLIESYFGLKQQNRPKFISYVTLLSYFFVKKIPLSRRVGYVMDGSMGEWVSEWEMYVCHTNQIGSTMNSQSNFLL